MASAQCYKPASESCQQKNSLGQKVTDIASSVVKHHGPTPNHCHSKTQVQSYPNNTTTNTQTHSYSQTHTIDPPATTSPCQGKARRTHKRNLFQKIKDGLSGHSSDSSSSSESDNDNEKCEKRKN
ncbi:Cold-shock protein [Quillaja saponaria]|uniref:Cold-shock protein n=1 Tax=Quillaja saponaria TaxID=32244 RepID=A0AAD7LPK5_QUISA|nr:Cold-shock protein [Quillaja saponaria]